MMKKLAFKALFQRIFFVTHRKNIDGSCSFFPCPAVVALPVRRASQGWGSSKDKFLSRELNWLLFSSSWYWRFSTLLRLSFQWLSNFNNTSSSSVAFSKGGCCVPWTGAMNLFSEPSQVFALLPGSCLCITVPSTCCFQDHGSRVGKCLWWWIFGLNPLPKQRSTSWV